MESNVIQCNTVSCISMASIFMHMRIVIFSFTFESVVLKLTPKISSPLSVTDEGYSRNASSALTSKITINYIRFRGSLNFVV